MLIAVWPLVFALVGILVYALASHPKMSEAGRLTFFAGMLGLVFSLLRHALRVG